MDGGGDVVGRLLVRGLQNEFSQVRFHNADAVALQRGIQVNLLGGDAFPLNQRTHMMALADFLNVSARFPGIAGKKEMPAIAGDTFRKLLDERNAIGQRIFLDAARFVFQRIVVGESNRGLITAAVETSRVMALGGGFRVQREANGAAQDLLRLLRGYLPRRCHPFRHDLTEHQNVKLMRSMDPADQWSHIRRGAWPADENEIFLKGGTSKRLQPEKVRSEEHTSELQS